MNIYSLKPGPCRFITHSGTINRDLELNNRVYVCGAKIYKVIERCECCNRTVWRFENEDIPYMYDRINEDCVSDLLEAEYDVVAKGILNTHIYNSQWVESIVYGVIGKYINPDFIGIFTYETLDKILEDIKKNCIDIRILSQDAKLFANRLHTPSQIIDSSSTVNGIWWMDENKKYAIYGIEKYIKQT